MYAIESRFRRRNGIGFARWSVVGKAEFGG
jgi:hypothetical protein